MHTISILPDTKTRSAALGSPAGLISEAILLHRGNSDGIDRVAGRPILIYGAGNYGRIIYRLLCENGVPRETIAGFLDRAAGNQASLLGLPVHCPDDPAIRKPLREKAEVVIAIYSSLNDHQGIAAWLHQLNYSRVRSGYEIAISFHTANDPVTRISTSGFLANNLDHILGGLNFFEDDESISTYVNHFCGYAQCEPKIFHLEQGHKQYFPPIALNGKGHSRFIDCGAFDGDTVRDLVATDGKVESLALFEPCEENFEKLRQFVGSQQKDLADRIVLFPCGVWDSTTRLRFSGDAAAASIISDEGTAFIQCVALDDALPGFNPTCIKMDIEGAELHALRGAEKIIREHTPDLAVSVYHSLSHFWEIPRMLKTWVPEYRFFIRTYAAAGFETILYATAVEGAQ